MKKLIATSLLASATLLSKPASAQAPRSAIAPNEPGQLTNEQVQRKSKSKSKGSATDIANMQRRMNMNPEDAKRDQQVELLEARAGGGSANTSFGRASGPARQYEKGAGGFMVRKFKAGKHTRNAMMKKGQGRVAPGIDPKGKPLTHKKKKKFLFF
ncbi:hypothetical protein [Hymenobacter canadensis]|uniref:DUF4890 domain-containing protein n=1 Tax=Hymenobacter canadensis TaxID=2999067 RepID=A0ABY7LME4_9BACT|nr:hypothetical protein [Hymenobacter canadensis]WBA41615.1 hypothetical protein O3303_17590 [Hymenobacter canadensis]